jgi:signal transduction histidine kinase
VTAPRDTAAAARPTRFRSKLLVAMMLVVSAVTVLGLMLSERNLTANTERAMEASFRADFTALSHAQALRVASLVERSRALVRRSRIQAALEDSALDLLYPSAREELRDLLTPSGATASAPANPTLRARFYRFLDLTGAIVSPPLHAPDVGALSAADEARLALPRLPDRSQLGYLAVAGTDGLTEVFTTPVVSNRTGEVIAALVLGFAPLTAPGPDPDRALKSALWLTGTARSTRLTATGATASAADILRAVEDPVRVMLDAVPHLLFAQRLNPDSLYPAAYEVCAYPLTGLVARQRTLRWQILGAGALVLLVGLAASHYLAARLSAPVEHLAVVSAENLAQRVRAEAALEHTHEELQRSARFSADASHQLKTPVTVLRAGLEELLARDNLSPDECQQLSALVHQTYRLSSVIEDLLLLSRLDAGRLQLAFAPLDLAPLLAASLDDLGAVPDSLDLAIETDLPTTLLIAGEKRYTSLILQNLLENARKYNTPGGRVRVTSRVDGPHVVLAVGNTGHAIPPAAHAHIFERFHRGGMGENVPGYGLGLNLARELARLHGGDLRLARSADGWTEFEVSFRLAA